MNKLTFEQFLANENIHVSFVDFTLVFNLLFENPMTFNCFWAIKNFQLTLMTK